MPPLDYAQQLEKYSSERIRLANKYAKDRKEYGDCKAGLDILFAAKILKLTEKKKNLGYETGLLLMIAESGETERDLYKKMITHYNNYKAIEKMLDALESKIMSIQSVMRYNRENDGGQR